MIKVLVLISFLLVVNNLYSQNILFSDSINYDNEQDSIEIFLRNFIAEKDSIKLQKYIQFPQFSIISSGMQVRRSFLGKMSDKQIRKHISKYPSDDPFYFYKLKYDGDTLFRKHLEMNNFSIQEYCYKDELCRVAMCGYLIRRFKFSENCKPWVHPYKYYLKNTSYIVLEIGCDYIIGIIKTIGKYKVLYVKSSM